MPGMTIFNGLLVDACCVIFGRPGVFGGRMGDGNNA
jgi:hypothetical protein